MVCSIVSDDVLFGHAYLAKDWRENEPQIRTKWASLGHESKHAMFHGVSLLHEDMGPGYAEEKGDAQLIPEWTVEKIIESDPEYFLELVEQRAAQSLYEQAFKPFKSFVSDYTHVDKLSTPEAQKARKIKRGIMAMVGERQQVAGNEVPLIPRLRKYPEEEQRTLGTRRIPAEQGSLILKRQRKMITKLALMVCSLLDADQQSSSEPHSECGKLPLRKTLSEHLGPQLTKKILLPRLAERALNGLLCAETKYHVSTSTNRGIAKAIMGYYVTRPELIADSSGRVLGRLGPNSVGAAFFDYVNDGNRARFVWKYMYELTCLLHQHGDQKSLRLRILQQLSNLCHFDFARVKVALRRVVQAGMGADCFVRIDNAVDDRGNARTAMKDKPEELAAEGTVLHAMLTIVHPATGLIGALKPVKVILKYLHTRRPWPVQDAEYDAFESLHHTASMMMDLSELFPMPAFSKSKEATFTSELRRLESNLVQSKPQVDVSSLFPLQFDLGAIKDPCGHSQVDEAMNILATCCRQNCGLSIPEMWESAMRKSLSQLKRQMVQDDADSGEVCIPQSPRKVRAKHAAEKQELQLAATAEQEKTCQPKLNQASPKNISQVDDACPSPLDANLGLPSPAAAKCAPLPRRKIKVSASSAQVFSILFDKSLSRSGLHWTDFEAAMSELEFRITPKKGSSVCFEPPEHLGLGRSLTVHKPHGSRTEGFRLVVLRQRLTRAFGWDNETFVVR